MDHKKTFKEFVASDEKVATNLLSARLKLLESLHIISKRKLSGNKKENVYLLTQKGIDLVPMIMEIVLWGDKYVRKYNLKMNNYETTAKDKQALIDITKNNYKQFAEQVVNEKNG